MNSDKRNSEFGRWKVWIVQCVAAANRYGVSPLSATQLHMLLYLANTLATFFEVQAVRGRVLKRGDLPFYPDIQREIDRLAFCGVLRIHHVQYGHKSSLAAFYDLGPNGESISKNLLVDAEVQKLVQLFQELISASLNRFLNPSVNIGEFDANYSDKAVSDGEVVDFSEWQSLNYNQYVSEYMLEELSALKPNSKRDSVRLYCDYLNEAIITNG